MDVPCQSCLGRTLQGSSGRA